MQWEPRYETLVDICANSVRSFGPRELFGTKKDGRWTWTTYAEFGALVDAFRGGLVSLGVHHGDRVAIVSNNRVEWAVVAYACYGLGAVVVPMYEAQTPKDWEFVVHDCGATTLVVANESVLAKARGLFDAAPLLKRIVLLDGTTGGDARVVTYAALLASGQPTAAIRPAPDDVATLMYTSGTMGNPKGVVLTQRNIASNVSAGHEVFPLQPTDRSVSILPWAHAFGQTAELHMLFSFGASMAISEGVAKILENLAEVQPTVLCSVPAIFNRVYTAVQQQLATRPAIVRSLVARAIRVNASALSGSRPAFYDVALRTIVDKVIFEKVRARLGGRLRFAISGGAALSREVAEFVDAIGVVVFEGYGLTETSPVIAANGPMGRKLGSVGRPFPGVRVVIDPKAADGNPGEEGSVARVEGEIVVYGPNVMKGYLGRPEETAAVFTPDGGLRTGDMGYVDEDGFLFITGRIKEQYKLENGKYVVPSPLEEKLKLSPYVANTMVFGANKPHNVALIVANVPAIRKWAEANDVPLPADADALAKDERVRALLSEEIKMRSADFKGFERVRDFAVVAREFSVDNGMLTPKLSVKRRKVLEAYGSLLDELYKKGG